MIHITISPIETIPIHFLLLEHGKMADFLVRHRADTFRPMISRMVASGFIYFYTRNDPHRELIAL